MLILLRVSISAVFLPEKVLLLEDLVTITFLLIFVSKPGLCDRQDAEIIGGLGVVYQ